MVSLARKVGKPGTASIAMLDKPINQINPGNIESPVATDRIFVITGAM